MACRGFASVLLGFEQRDRRHPSALVSALHTAQPQLRSANARGQAEDGDRLRAGEVSLVPALVAAQRHVEAVPAEIQDRLESPVRCHGRTDREQPHPSLGDPPAQAGCQTGFSTVFAVLQPRRYAWLRSALSTV